MEGNPAVVINVPINIDSGARPVKIPKNGFEPVKTEFN